MGSNYRISNTAVLNPSVYPKDTTVYTLTVTDQGCIDSAKIKVNVLQFITVKLDPDSGICRTDSFTLRPVSDALSYRWRESTGINSLNDTTARYPRAAPLVTTTYFVTANLGYCQDSAKRTIYVSPYPTANAGNDAAICFGTRTQLSGTITGTYFSWSPTSTLINTSTLQPIAGPMRTTSYVLTAGDTQYCKKQASDTVLIRVIPPFNISAGKDTSVTLGQALQLIVTGGDSSFSYSWSPVDFLNDPTISNPVATITSNIGLITYIAKATTAEGCSATDDIKVTVYNSGPRILIPSGFTPNADGRNDVLKPVLIGISQFDFFNVYNRWGQLIFTTSDRSKGWDGSFNGTAQGSGTYICTAQGKAFNGNVVFVKETVVLLR